MAQPILLRGAKQLLTLSGPNIARRGANLRNLALIQDGSVLIHDGVIVSVGSTRRLENLKEARRALDIPVHGRVVMPSFVDAGLQVSLSRSETSYRPKRVSEFHDDSLSLMRACLQHGTVTADVKASANARDYHSDLTVLRKLTKIGSSPVRMFRTWRVGPGTSSLGIQGGDLEQTLATLLGRNLIDSVGVEPSSDGLVHAEHAIVAAKEAGISVQLLWSGGSPRTFEQLMQRFEPRSVLYRSAPNASEAAILAESPAVAILPAGKQAFEGPGGTAGRDLVDSSVAIALSSGYHSVSASNFSMQMSIALAVARLGLTVEEALSAATVNAAYAIGCGEMTGTLEVGKQADLVILNLPDYRELPEQFGINHVAMVFRSGAIVLNRTRWRAPAEHQPASRVHTKLL